MDNIVVPIRPTCWWPRPPECERLTVLFDDREFETVATVTGQPMRWSPDVCLLVDCFDARRAWSQVISPATVTWYCHPYKDRKEDLSRPAQRSREYA